MKKILTILLIFAAFGSANLCAEPDGTVGQRIENAAATPTVKGGVGRIYLSAGNVEATFSIYSITGQLLKVVKLTEDSHLSVELPKGFYVVRCSGFCSLKVVVK